MGRHGRFSDSVAPWAQQPAYDVLSCSNVDSEGRQDGVSEIKDEEIFGERQILKGV